MATFLWVLVILIGICKFITSISESVQSEKRNNDLFFRNQDALDARYREEARQKDVYYVSGRVGMGPDYTRHADGSPRE